MAEIDFSNHWYRLSTVVYLVDIGNGKVVVFLIQNIGNSVAMNLLKLILPFNEYGATAALSRWLLSKLL